MLIYTATLYSLNASFNDVFVSVLSLRLPMINAQGTWYSPALNFLVYDPGITTDLSGTYPLCSTGSFPVVSIIFVDIVSTTFAPSTASFPTLTPSTTIQREPMKAPSSIITGAACTG